MALTDKQAELLMKQLYEKMYMFACARCRNREVALDITQEALLVFWKKRRSIEYDDSVRWLYRTTWNKINEYLRKNGVEKNFVSLDSANLSYTENFSDITDESDEMFTEVQKRILGLLTDEERRVFIALFIQKKDISLFAEEEGISYNAASERKSRLKKKAKQLYKDTYFLLLVLSFKYF